MTITSICHTLFILTTLILLQACTSKEQLEQTMLGTWEGGNALDISWCVNHGKNNQLHLFTKLGHGRANDHYPLGAGKVYEQKGTWELSEGGRFFYSSTLIREYDLPAKEVAQISEQSTTPLPQEITEDTSTANVPTSLIKSSYIIKNITDTQMHYRSMKEPDKWYTSKRVEKCSAKFFPDYIPPSS